MESDAAPENEGGEDFTEAFFAWLKVAMFRRLVANQTPSLLPRNRAQSDRPLRRKPLPREIPFRTSFRPLLGRR